MTPNAIQLLVDSCHGIYAPQRFVTNFDLSLWTNIDQENIDILKDPDHEHYWEAWDETLNTAEFHHSGYIWRLQQDGDLWAVCHELMTNEEKKNFGFED